MKKNRVSFGRVIAARALADPTEVVVSEADGARLSAAELDARSTALARRYRDCGVGRDDLVSVSLPNGIDFVLACAAVWKLGATPQPLGPMPAAERAGLERLARPALAVGARPADPSIAWLPGGDSQWSGLSSAPLPDTWARRWKAPASSGSTGRPKIVASTAPALIDPEGRVAPFLPRDQVQLVTAPLWHSAAFTYAFRGLLTGHRLVLAHGFDEHRFAELVARYHITWTLLSPSGIHRLVRLPGRPELPSLRTVLHLGAPVGTADKYALIDWLGPDRVVEVYAGSESNGLTMITGVEWLERPGSVGRPIGGTEVKIVRGDGAPAGVGEIGEVWLHRGARPAYTYLGATTARTAAGWDTLGDLGFVDREGYLTIVDRAADVIESDDITIYPARVEQVLESHPAVRGAVVYRTAGHRVAATVDVGHTDVDHGDFTAELLEFARTRLTTAELPSHIDITRAPLRNDAGKVRRSTFTAPAPSTARV